MAVKARCNIKADQLLWSVFIAEEHDLRHLGESKLVDHCHVVGRGTGGASVLKGRMSRLNSALSASLLDTDHVAASATCCGFRVVSKRINDAVARTAC